MDSLVYCPQFLQLSAKIVKLSPTVRRKFIAKCVAFSLQLHVTDTGPFNASRSEVGGREESMTRRSEGRSSSVRRE